MNLESSTAVDLGIDLGPFKPDIMKQPGGLQPPIRDSAA